MDIYRSLGEIRNAESSGLVDWTAAARAATASTPRGRLDLDAEAETAYREAILEARGGVEAVIETDLELPEHIEVLDRHHWIERAALSFDRILQQTMPEFRQSDLSTTVNTGTASFTLSVLGRRVVGQYDPALFGEPSDRALYLVHPNLLKIAEELTVDLDPFRRWVIHHEVSHAAEFALAPWLSAHLEDQIETVLEELGQVKLDREALAELNRTMTVIEGFAELLMDEAIAEDVSDLRERLEARRAGLGPIRQLIDWLLGITAKREQYKRGRAFFLEVQDARGIDATLAVWDDPTRLPTAAELTDPRKWIDRVDP